MVGPGEVDDDLEPETAEECSKYGEVDKCVIFEVIIVSLNSKKISSSVFVHHIHTYAYSLPISIL